MKINTCDCLIVSGCKLVPFLKLPINFSCPSVFYFHCCRFGTVARCRLNYDACAISQQQFFPSSGSEQRLMNIKITWVGNSPTSLCVSLQRIFYLFAIHFPSQFCRWLLILHCSFFFIMVFSLLRFSTIGVLIQTMFASINCSCNIAI